MLQEHNSIFYLGVSLAIGLLVGVERGWRERETAEGDRVAGVRTYGLIGFLGGASALVAQHTSPLIIGFIFIGLTGLFASVYVANISRINDAGITSIIASLLTYILGVIAGLGEVTIAAPSAVVLALLLGLKPTLHQWVSRLKSEELRAGIQLLLISIVLLPILPNKGYGPWSALNPYEIWLMVVLIATISFIGYIAIKLGGTEKGAIFTGIFGGLASSTALTLHFSRMAECERSRAQIFSTGILLACGTTFLRCLLVAGILNRELVIPLLPPMLAMAAFAYGPAIYYWSKLPTLEQKSEAVLRNPLEIKTAVGFGLLLTIIMLLGKASQAWMGDKGLLILSAASGIADVDAITLSVARMSTTTIDVQLAVSAIIITASVNTLIKSLMTTAIGKGVNSKYVGLPLCLCAFVGFLWVWLRL